MLHQANVGKLQQPAPHPVLQHWAADQQPEQRARRVQQIDAVIKPKDLVDDIAVDSALRYHFFAQAREELLEYLASSGEQPVRVAALWDAFARLVRFGERIAFEDGDLVVVIGQCRSSQEAAYAPPITIVCLPRCAMSPSPSCWVCCSGMILTSAGRASTRTLLSPAWPTPRSLATAALWLAAGHLRGCSKNCNRDR